MQKITCKLVFDRSRDGSRPYFVPTTFEEMVLVEKQLKEGEVYQVKISKGRSLKSLGKYWQIVHAVGHFKDLSPDYVHMAFKQEFFGYKDVENPLTGEVQRETQSISFDSIDEMKFKEFLNFIVKKIEAIGMDIKEMLWEYKMEC
jgi:hypothetical protein